MCTNVLGVWFDEFNMLREETTSQQETYLQVSKQLSNEVSIFIKMTSDIYAEGLTVI